jgi:hypothetical protein
MATDIAYNALVGAAKIAAIPVKLAYTLVEKGVEKFPMHALAYSTALKVIGYIIKMLPLLGLTGYSIIGFSLILDYAMYQKRWVVLNALKELTANNTATVFAKLKEIFSLQTLNSIYNKVTSAFHLA